MLTKCENINNYNLNLFNSKQQKAYFSTISTIINNHLKTVCIAVIKVYKPNHVRLVSYANNYSMPARIMIV